MIFSTLVCLGKNETFFGRFVCSLVIILLDRLTMIFLVERSYRMMSIDLTTHVVYFCMSLFKDYKNIDMMGTNG